MEKTRTMADTPDLSSISKLQIHYWFSDKTHTMDALVQNKCEREVLEIAKLVAKQCSVSITLETEPSGKGGLKTWLTLAAKTPKKTPVAKLALVNVLVAAALVSGGNTPSIQLLNMLLDNLFAGREHDDALRQHLAKLKTEALTLWPMIEQHSAIKKKRSNFYSQLKRYPKVKSLSVVLTDHSKKTVTEEQVVGRESFNAFNISPGSRITHVIENAVVDIVSPVLVKGNHKWKGTYNQEPISFTMKADEFMALVQSGKVEFKSGSSINCRLEIEKKISNTGAEKITGYTITGVGSYSENGKTTETPETKQRHKESAISKKQLDLFG